MVEICYNLDILSTTNTLRMGQGLHPYPATAHTLNRCFTLTMKARTTKYLTGILSWMINLTPCHFSGRKILLVLADRPPLCGRWSIVADTCNPDSPRKKRGLSKQIETNTPAAQALIRCIINNFNAFINK